MAKKPVKKSASLPTTSSFSEFDKVFDNFRKDLEKSFHSFPRMNFPSFPKLHETGCDVIDEGNQLRMKMNVPGLKKSEITKKRKKRKITLERSDIACLITRLCRYLKK